MHAKSEPVPTNYLPTHFFVDIYFDFVAPTLNQALYTETWQDGGGDLPSNCSDSFPVYNIKYVNLTSTINFSDGDDHSKWAVSPYGGQYVCIGDVNRQVKRLDNICVHFVNVLSEISSFSSRVSLKEAVVRCVLMIPWFGIRLIIQFNLSNLAIHPQRKCDI